MIIEFDGRRAEISEDIIDRLYRYIEENEMPEFDVVCECSRLDWHAPEPPAEETDDSGLYADEPLGTPYAEDLFGDDLGEFAPLEDAELPFGFEPREKTFQAYLFELIDRKGMKDSEVYKRAELDRRHFSKIRNNEDYRPTKGTAVALSFALGLNLDETLDLIGRAGYYLSFSSKSDLIIRFCIESGMHDLLDVNALLYKYDQPLLGSQA